MSKFHTHRIKKMNLALYVILAFLQAGWWANDAYTDGGKCVVEMSPLPVHCVCREGFCESCEGFRVPSEPREDVPCVDPDTADLKAAVQKVDAASREASTVLLPGGAPCDVPLSLSVETSPPRVVLPTGVSVHRPPRAPPRPASVSSRVDSTPSSEDPAVILRDAVEKLLKERLRSAFSARILGEPSLFTTAETESLLGQIDSNAIGAYLKYLRVWLSKPQPSAMENPVQLLLRECAKAKSNPKISAHWAEVEAKLANLLQISVESSSSEQIVSFPNLHVGSGATGDIYLGFVYQPPAQVREVLAGFKHEVTNAYEVENLRKISSLDPKWKLHGFRSIGTEVVFYRPFFSGGTLQGKTYSEAQQIDVALDILDDMIKLYDAGIVHRDIKPENVLVDSRGRRKLTDFSLSVTHAQFEAFVAQAKKDGRMIPAEGTPPYMSPDPDGALSAKSDTWALALTLMTLSKQYDPLKSCGSNSDQILSNIAMIANYHGLCELCGLFCDQELLAKTPKQYRTVSIFSLSPRDQIFYLLLNAQLPRRPDARAARALFSDLKAGKPISVVHIDEQGRYEVMHGAKPPAPLTIGELREVPRSQIPALAFQIGIQPEEFPSFMEWWTESERRQVSGVKGPLTEAILEAFRKR